MSDLPMILVKEIASYLDRGIYVSVAMRDWEDKNIACLKCGIDRKELILTRTQEEWHVRDRRHLFEQLRRIPCYKIRSIVALQINNAQKQLYVWDSCEGILSVGACSWILWTAFQS